MSELRPTLIAARPGTPSLANGTAYYAIYGAVQGQHGLCHGELDDRVGDHCAIGSYFAVRKHAALPHALIDEVAAVNDSVPHLSKAKRKHYVLRWLRWKLDQAGIKGIPGARP